MFFNKKILGDIGYYNLVDWWMNSFTKEERDIIEDIYQPISIGGDTKDKPLTQGKIDYSSQSKVAFLSNLAGWFNNPRYRNIANMIMQKAQESLHENAHSILDEHFLYSQMISLYYPQREDNDMLDLAISACKKQIDISTEAKKAFEEEHKESRKRLREDALNPLYAEVTLWNGKEHVLLKDFDFDNEDNTNILPAHKGYEQLAIIFDKKGLHEEAIKLCAQAKMQGWSGSWDSRLERYRKKVKSK